MDADATRAPAAARTNPLGGARLRVLGARGGLRRAGSLVLAGLTLVGPASATQETAAEWNARIGGLERRLREEDEVDRAVEELLDVVFELEERVLHEGPATLAYVTVYAYACVTVANVNAELLPEGVSAVDQMAKAAEAADNAGDQELIAYAAYHFGRALLGSGQPADARSVVEDALARTARTRFQAQFLRVLLARLEKDRGNLARARDLIEAAERGRASISPSWGSYAQLHAGILGVGGEIELALGRLDRAAGLVAAEEQVAEATDLADLIGDARVHRTDLYLAQERYVSLERHVQEALNDERLGGLPERRALLQLRLASGRGERGRLQPAYAESAARTLRELVAEARLPSQLMLEAEVRLLELLLRDAPTEEARAVCASARERFARLLAKEEEGHGPLEEGALLAALQCKLALADGGDARALGEARDELEGAFERFLGQWGTTPQLPGGIGFLQYGPRRRILSELVRVTLAGEADDAVEQALQYVLRAQGMGSTARAAGFERVSLEAAQRPFHPQSETVLVYLPAPDRSHVFAFLKGRWTHHELLRFDGLKPLLADYVRAITTAPDTDDLNRGRAELTRAAADLARQLFPAPVRRKLERSTRVTIVGLELLGYAPFEYLPLAEGRVLGKRAAVSYLPSLPVGALLAERPDPRAKEWRRELVLFGAPDVDDAHLLTWPQLSPLTLGAAEERDLAGAFAPRATIFRGPKATAERLRTMDFSTTRVLMLFAHGVALTDRERRVALLMAPAREGDDGLLLCKHVDEMTVPPLVVVIACEADRGHLRRGDDGVAALSGPLLSGGARAVVISPIKLEVGAMRTLVRVMNERLVAGDSPAEALRVARLALEETEGRDHPFYGLIHVVGLGHEPVF